MRTDLPKALWVILLAVALAFHPSASARGEGDLPRYTRITMDQGLSNNSVYCIRQDRSGFMWFGTFAGLNRYDGKEFRVHKPGGVPGRSDRPGTLQGSVVFALEEDRKGRLWVGTDGGGLSVYDPARDAFRTYRNQPGDRGLPSDRIFSLAADASGGVWVGTGGAGLAHFDGQDWVRIPGAPFRSARCLLPAGNGELLVGSEEAGLVRFDPERGVFTPVGLASRPRGGGTVRAMAAGRDGRIWVGTATGEVESYRPGAPRAMAALASGGSAVRALAFDALGRLWVGYEGHGLAVYNLDGGKPRLVFRDPAAGNIRAIGTDREGLVWIGRKDGGLLHHNPRSEAFSVFALPSARGMAETRSGTVLIGTDGAGLFAIPPGARREVKVPLPLGYERVYAVIEDRQGALWIGTDGQGLLRKGADGSLRRFRRSPEEPSSLSSDVVWALLEDRRGRIWVGTEGGGLDRWDPVKGGFEHHRHRDDDAASLLGSSIRAIHEGADGRLWIGTWDGGLSRLDPETGRFDRFPQLADTSVNAVLEDSKGRLWVGTGTAGLARLQADTTFTYLGKRDGLAGDTVMGLMEGKDGSLWVATAERVSRYDPADGSIHHLGQEDGLADSECAQNACLQGRDGTLWVGGPDGVTRLHPQAWQPAHRLPTVVLTRLEAYGTEGPQAIPAVPERPRLMLDWRNTGLRFEVAVLDYAAPKRNRYAMLIEGLGRQWIPLGEQPGAVIPPLPPGSFTVRIKGANGNGVWSDPVELFSVHVDPPLWRHPWGLTAAILGLAAVIGGGLMLRIRALARRTQTLRSYSRHIQEAREEERLSAARDVHDEIGQHLAALNLQAYWVHTHPDAPEKLRRERVEEMLACISEAMTAVKSVATQLRPVALDALALQEAVAWYARAFSRRSGIPVTLDMAEGFPKVKGPLATGLFRVLQEMLTNISRHSQATAACVRLFHGPDEIVLEAVDDGRGIDPDKVRADDAFGIMGMRERCAAFGGTLTLAGTPGKGTVVTARIPYPPRATGKETA